MNSPVLENDHNVYILGAGFSVDGGMPLVQSFMARMRDSLGSLSDQRRNREIEAIKQVLQFRLEAAGAAHRTPFDPDNIEELFSLASAENYDALEEHMRLAIAATLDHCKRKDDRDLIVAGGTTLSVTPPGQWRPAANTASIGMSGFNYAQFGTRYQVLCAALFGNLGA
jgi:hypothetical protein